MLTPGTVIAYLPIVVAVVLLFCGASWQIFWTSTDAARYQCYALAFWLGGHATALLPPTQCIFLHPSSLSPLPLHTLPLEYPPLTLAIFSLSLPAPLMDYQVLFAFWMALAAALIYWLLLRYAPRGGALAFALYAVIGAWATAEGRFDLLPAALTLICVIAAERRRWTLAYVALAFGVLLKLYPLLFLPALLIMEQRSLQRLAIPEQGLTLRTAPGALWQALRGMRAWAWKNTALFCGVLVVVTGLFALLSFYGAVASQLSYFVGRPVQIESTGSTFLWLASLFGLPAHVVYTFGSVNIESSLGGAVSLLGDLAFVLGYGAALWLLWRGKLDVVQGCIAILLVFIVTGKVFSPQYLIWLLPLLAYAGAFNGFWLLTWSAISLLTTFIYPFLYMRTANAVLVAQVPGFIPAVAVRDVLFVLLTLCYLCDWFKVRQRRPLPDVGIHREQLA